jgi:glycosyltransferase involved in cell wall biosynthesis
MIDSFKIFEMTMPNSILYFIGEGEDYSKILDYISVNSLTGKVILAGKKGPKEIASFLSASDLFIMGSSKEGWSTSLIEAIACGIPACVTNFSSAKDIIVEGQNGYVVNDYDSELFAQKMLSAIQLPSPIDNTSIQQYSVSKLRNDLLKIWKLI